MPMYENWKKQILMRLDEGQAWSLYEKGYTIYRGTKFTDAYLNKETLNDKPWLQLAEEGYFNNNKLFFIRMMDIPYLSDTSEAHRKFVEKM